VEKLLDTDFWNTPCS
jgi:hypothetical protein